MTKESIVWKLTYHAGCLGAIVLAIPMIFIIQTVVDFLWWNLLETSTQSIQMGVIGIFYSVPITIFLAFTFINYLRLALLKRHYFVDGSILHHSTFLSLLMLLAILFYFPIAAVIATATQTETDFVIGGGFFIILVLISRQHRIQMRDTGANDDVKFWLYGDALLSVLYIASYYTDLEAIILLLIITIHSSMPMWTINYMLDNADKPKRKRKNDEG